MSNNLKENPLVSICIPAYNVENYIKDTLTNILFQSYSNIEIIIVNDGSTEPEVLEILSKYKPYSEIIIKQLEEN